MNCTGKRRIMQHDKVDPATCKCVSYCPQATPPKTNADRIRSMSDEELASFIISEYYVPHCPIPDCPENNSFESCVECWLDWLKQGG